MTTTLPAASIDAYLERARTHLQRVTAAQASIAACQGALLVDIRPVVLRAADGEIPDALVIDRNTLEWRLDPTSPWRVPQGSDHDQHIVLICNEGYASSLAAVTLQELGLHNATDLVGGFQAWRAAGLPVLQQSDPLES